MPRFHRREVRNNNSERRSTAVADGTKVNDKSSSEKVAETDVKEELKKQYGEHAALVDVSKILRKHQESNKRKREESVAVNEETNTKISHNEDTSLEEDYLKFMKEVDDL